MRKLLSGLLVLVMLVALLPVTALAAQEAGPVAASAVLENGTVTLTLTAGEETTSGRLTVAYDKELPMPVWRRREPSPVRKLGRAP